MPQQGTSWGENHPIYPRGGAFLPWCLWPLFNPGKSPRSPRLGSPHAGLGIPPGAWLRSWTGGTHEKPGQSIARHQAGEKSWMFPPPQPLCCCCCWLPLHPPNPPERLAGVLLSAADGPASSSSSSQRGPSCSVQVSQASPPASVQSHPVQLSLGILALGRPDAPLWDPPAFPGDPAGQTEPPELAFPHSAPPPPQLSASSSRAKAAAARAAEQHFPTVCGARLGSGQARGGPGAFPRAARLARKAALRALPGGSRGGGGWSAESGLPQLRARGGLSHPAPELPHPFLLGQVLLPGRLQARSWETNAHGWKRPWHTVKGRAFPRAHTHARTHEQVEQRLCKTGEAGQGLLHLHLLFKCLPEQQVAASQPTWAAT